MQSDRHRGIACTRASKTENRKRKGGKRKRGKKNKAENKIKVEQECLKNAEEKAGKKRGNDIDLRDSQLEVWHISRRDKKKVL